MAAYFHYLKIEKFRGIRSLRWHPSAGVNVILGGGNVGKSTLMESIALLLSPTNSYTLADTDYWSRDVEAEFLIEAVIFTSAVCSLLPLPQGSNLGISVHFEQPNTR